MTGHLDILVPLAIGIYMFLLGMGLPLPPKTFKGSKGVAISGLLMIIISTALMPSSSSAPSAGSAPAAAIAAQLKRETQLPKREKNGLSVIDITSKDQTLIYVYKVDYESNEARRMAARAVEEIEKTACGNSAILEMLKNGISIQMDYRDAKGKLAGKAIIRPRKCGL